MNISFENRVEKETREFISKIVSDSVKTVKEVLPLENVKFVIVFDEKKVIPEYGVGGYCDPKSIDIYLEKRREADWSNWLPSTVYHEWHHMARWRGPGYGDSLLESLISEGLAQHFEVQVEKGEAPFFANFLDQKTRNEMMLILENEFSDKKYDHSRWFFGRGEFPFLAAYDLSYYIVSKYMEEVNRKPSQLVDLSENEVAKFLSFIK